MTKCSWRYRWLIRAQRSQWGMSADSESGILSVPCQSASRRQAQNKPVIRLLEDVRGQRNERDTASRTARKRRRIYKVGPGMKYKAGASAPLGKILAKHMGRNAC